MKLIDLLVKELPSRGDWPEFRHNLQAVQDVDGLIKFHIVGYKLIFGLNNSRFWGSDTRKAWFDSHESERNFHSKELSDDYDSAIVTREQYEAALKPVWNGEGAPPVGTECEALYDSDDVRWYKVKVIGHDKKHIVARWVEGEKKLQLFEYEMSLNAFRPIRTEAECQREKIIADIFQQSGIRSRDGGKQSATDLYTAIAAHKIAGVTLVPTVSEIIRATETCSREDAERIVAMLKGE